MAVLYVGGRVMTLGDFVRNRRGRLGLTQRQLAEMIDRDPTWVSRLETNRAKEMPAPEEMTLLAAALRCSESDLLRSAGYLKSEEPAMHTMRDDFNDRIDNLPPEAQETVRRVIDAFNIATRPGRDAGGV